MNVTQSTFLLQQLFSYSKDHHTGSCYSKKFRPPNNFFSDAVPLPRYELPMHSLFLLCFRPIASNNVHSNVSVPWLGHPQSSIGHILCMGDNNGLIRSGRRDQLISWVRPHHCECSMGPWIEHTLVYFQLQG